ncbi:probable glutathione S-transferase GSTU6 [Triticum dicoccoides]|uniref:probable glutathione S-transferase GSTU6 n=1 Tax=Triticum dicoccoides TaxID=85692 RepID=UPI000E798066|nr:probable glutathione S-transferase GSTU6 [Triticum dicoccoides]
MAGGGEEKVKLLGTWASPFVLRAQLALSFKGVSFENVDEDLSSKSDLLLRSNPVHKAVPVLIHNGRPVCESLVIVQYVNEAFDGSPLLPADPHERAVARFWAAFIGDKLVAPWHKVFTAKIEEEKAEWMEQTLAAVDVLEGGLKECSRGGSFFGGDNVGYVDVVLGGAVPWVYGTEALSGTRLFDAGRVPLLAAWLERFGALDTVKAVMADIPTRLVELAKKKQAEAAAAATAGDC